MSDDSLILRTPLPKVMRYILSGSTGAIVNIGTLFLLTHFMGVWYLVSSIIAFITSFFVSFTLQRWWTFDHRTRVGLMRHTTQYFVVAIANIFLNTALVYGFVDYLHVWYIAAQIIAGVFIAVLSFFVYRKIFAV